MVPAGCDRWRAEREEEGREEGRESFLCLHMYLILLFLGNDFVTFLPCKYGRRRDCIYMLPAVFATVHGCVWTCGGSHFLFDYSLINKS